jgi:2-polyprenyl-3-methyl-5-hydroxy-6-metoxy-1,4-benzoquinol methylase
VSANETMTNLMLTDRQQREREYYDEFSKYASGEITFGPVGTTERRPWNPHWSVHETVLARFTSPEQRLLDFGCGSGAAAVVHAAIGYEVYGFDISPNNIARAKQLAEQYGLGDRTHFEVKAAESLDYPSDYFDVITGLDILHHVEIPKAIAQCMRVLKRGGVAIFAEPLEVPLLDAIRNTRLVRWLVPNEKSFSRHITSDERKLRPADLRTIEGQSQKTTIRRFRFLSRFDRFVRPPDSKNASLLERIDYAAFRLFPPLQSLGGYGVLTIAKE